MTANQRVAKRIRRVAAPATPWFMAGPGTNTSSIPATLASATPRPPGRRERAPAKEETARTKAEMSRRWLVAGTPKPTRITKRATHSPSQARTPMAVPAARSGGLTNVPDAAKNDSR
jgi:hypothetical protein